MHVSKNPPSCLWLLPQRFRVHACWPMMTGTGRRYQSTLGKGNERQQNKGRTPIPGHDI